MKKKKKSIAQRGIEFANCNYPRKGHMIDSDWHMGARYAAGVGFVAGYKAAVRDVRTKLPAVRVSKLSKLRKTLREGNKRLRRVSIGYAPHCIPYEQATGGKKK
jgi:hypothetical protein